MSFQPGKFEHVSNPFTGILPGQKTNIADMAYTTLKKRRIVKAILTEYANNKYSIKSICANQGIDYKTFRKWEKELNAGDDSQVNCEKLENSTNESIDKISLEPNLEAQESPPIPLSYTASQQKRYESHRSNLRELAITALERYLNSWETEEKEQIGIKSTDGERIIGTRIRITKKMHLPPPLLIVFALENTAPSDFRRNRTDDTKEKENESYWIQLMKVVQLKTKD
jgi:hypothetical protein